MEVCDSCAEEDDYTESCYCGASAGVVSFRQLSSNATTTIIRSSIRKDAMNMESKAARRIDFGIRYHHSGGTKGRHGQKFTSGVQSNPQQ